MAALAKSMNLKCEVSIGLPSNPKDVYSIYNTTFDLGAQKRFHFDQYSGEQLVVNVRCCFAVSLCCYYSIFLLFGVSSLVVAIVEFLEERRK